jgi:hypothetical protein
MPAPNADACLPPNGQSITPDSATLCYLNQGPMGGFQVLTNLPPTAGLGISASQLVMLGYGTNYTPNDVLGFPANPCPDDLYCQNGPGNGCCQYLGLAPATVGWQGSAAIQSYCGAGSQSALCWGCPQGSAPVLGEGTIYVNNEPYTPYICSLLPQPRSVAVSNQASDADTTGSLWLNVYVNGTYVRALNPGSTYVFQLGLGDSISAYGAMTCDCGGISHNEDYQTATVSVSYADIAGPGESATMTLLGGAVCGSTFGIECRTPSPSEFYVAVNKTQATS